MARRAATKSSSAAPPKQGTTSQPKLVTTADNTGHVIDCNEAARRLGRDYFVVRAWLLNGTIPRIQFPSTRADKRKRVRPFRRLLCDAHDVDAFINACKVRKAG